MRALASILVLAAALAAGRVQAQPPVWRVHGSAGGILLFGSVHMLPRGLDWRPRELDEALAKADHLWFELPISQATDEAAARLTTQRGRAPVRSDLWSQVEGARKARLQAAATAVGVPAPQLSPMRPWLADLTLSLAADVASGAQAGEGVEMTLQSLAPPTARRHAFETVRQQVGFLADGPPDEQWVALDETAREILSDPDLYQRTIREWMAGDLEGLKHDDLDTLRQISPPAYRRMILDRNQRWAGVIARIARRPGRSVVVVGIGHLVGPDGVPALLRARGLQVDGP
jgi:uncharacterized protein YbaP (TraB family)